jgi:hypothetical protein
VKKDFTRDLPHHGVPHECDLVCSCRNCEAISDAVTLILGAVAAVAHCADVYPRYLTTGEVR